MELKKSRLRLLYAAKETLSTFISGQKINQEILESNEYKQYKESVQALALVLKGQEITKLITDMIDFWKIILQQNM